MLARNKRDEDAFSAASQLSSRIIIQRGRDVVETEARALAQLAGLLNETFADAVRLILSAPQRVIVSGMGKAGHVARKIASTFASTGTPALFLHPGEAAHGDLGMIMRGDVLLLLSNSGATPELRSVTRHAKALGCAIIGIGSQAHSPVMEAADVRLVLPVVPEACPVNIAPTTSTALMLALGDALAVAAMSARGFTRDRFRLLHPGGAIGSRLAPVDQIMHGAQDLPLVPLDMPMRDVLVTMTGKSFGIAGVVDGDGRLVGAITDGDLRRGGDGLFASTASEVMTADPKVIAEGSSSCDALAVMRGNRITALFVMAHDDPDRPVGLVHIHDLTHRGLL